MKYINLEPHIDRREGSDRLDITARFIAYDDTGQTLAHLVEVRRGGLLGKAWLDYPTGWENVDFDINFHSLRKGSEKTFSTNENEIKLTAEILHKIEESMKLIIEVGKKENGKN